MTDESPKQRQANAIGAASDQQSINVDELTKAISNALEGHRGIAYMPGMLHDVARIAARAALEHIAS